MAKTNKYYIGIDLGKKGGIAILKNGLPFYSTQIPKIGNEVDLKKLASIILYFKDENAHIVFEKFTGMFGYSKQAACSMNRQLGQVEMAVTIAKIPYTAIVPTVWQGVVWAGARLQYKTVTIDGKKKKKVDTKKTSLLVAQRLFPKETFLATKRSKKPHDGIVDAYMLAEYGKRKRL